MDGREVPEPVKAGLPDALEGALVALARAPRLLVALDFDGTLAPHVDVPSEARALPEAHDAVLRLVAASETPVAFVSGRALDSLLEVSGASDEVLLVGSHGVEVRLDASGRGSGLDEAELAARARLQAVLKRAARTAEGAWIEEKPAGFAVHTRLVVSPAQAQRVRAEALEAARAAIDGLTIRDGKDVLEFAVRAATKGDGVERLRAHTNADAVFYAGDDVTDEDAFAVLRPGDLGLKVGAGDTRAGHRVATPLDAARVLARLAELRTPSGPAAV